MASPHRILGLILFLLAAAPAMAGLSKELQSWAAGPAQWIMTSEEKREWRRLATDAEGSRFIDLFWARRDPTPGTPANEFRKEFDARVAYADEQYAEKMRRGALTERGRVYVVLGPSTNHALLAREENAQRLVSDQASVKKPSKTNREGFDTRQRAALELWIWEYSDARQFDMGRIEIAFIEDPVTRRLQRDPRRPDFSRAESVAIRKAIVNPELTSPPSWAVKAAEATAPPAPLAVAPPPTPGTSRLTLRRGASIDPSSAGDPFAGASESVFSSSDDVRWAVQHCPAKPGPPTLTTMLLIDGPLDGVVTESVTRRKETKAEPLSAQPGCYVLQGMIPVASLTAGRYKLSVVIDDPVTSESWTLEGEFRLAR